MNTAQTLLIPFEENLLVSKKIPCVNKLENFNFSLRKNSTSQRTNYSYSKFMYNDMFKNIVELEHERCISYYQLDDSKNMSECFKLAHAHVILDIIYTYLLNRYNKEVHVDVYNIFIHEGYVPTPINELHDFDSIGKFCEQLHLLYLRSATKINKHGTLDRSSSKENMIANGAVYTQKMIVSNIVEETLKNAIINNDTKVLDFASGTGRFYEELVSRFVRCGVAAEYAVLNCVDAIDIDPIAINILRLKALIFLPVEINKVDFEVLVKRIRLENALVPSSDNVRYNNYDFIVSNPPYLVLKPSKKTPGYLAEEMKQQVKYFNSCGLYNLATQGMLNLYQLSIERMLQMLKPGGRLGIICPSTLFADKSASKLRKHILLKNGLEKICYYPEKTVLFENNVTQATNIFYLTKEGKTDCISIELDNNEFNVSFSLIQKLFPENMEIPFISENSWQLLAILSNFKKLKEFPQIRNRRGELDLTLFQSFITSEDTGIRLVRGKMITSEKIEYAENEYVLPTFLHKKSQDFLQKDYGKVRLVGQNISNLENQNRLRFVFSSSTDILGNSCNYISADIEILRKLKLLFSSSLLNWRFNTTSSNNHINNYELDELPIPDLENINENISFIDQESLDRYVCSLYHVDYEQFKKLIL
jgi:Alw26I/Eco31I/Esp3I family type II restriction m6 adenine DNA methyltransferase